MNAFVGLGGVIAALTARLLSKGYERTTPGDLMEKARRRHPERYQVEKRQTRFTYVDGPMMFLGQQIVKSMEDAGFPAEIHQCFRSPDQQFRLYSQGRTTGGKIVTNALPFQSAHQLYEAVDIIHPERGWNVEPIWWETLAASVRTVAQKYGVELDHGHHWKFTDSAHIELRDWRKFRAKLKERYGEARVPTVLELWERFHELLPDVAKAYEKRGNGPPQAVQTARAMQDVR